MLAQNLLLRPRSLKILPSFRDCSREGDDRGLGLTFGGEVGVVVVREPQTVRGADGAFILKEQLPYEKTKEGYLLTPPALVVEVLSPGDRASELQTKLLEYFSAGVRLIWVVDPPNRRVTVCRPDGTSKSLQGTDVLWAPGILEQISTPVSRLFKGIEPFLPATPPQPSV